MGRKSSKFSSLIVLWVVCFLCIAGLPVQNTFCEQIDSSTCMDCHDDMAEKLNKTSHAIVSTSKQSARSVGCVSCHQNAEAHVDDPTADNMETLSELYSASVEEVCTTCHQPHQGIGMDEFDLHSAVDLSCVSCHSIHTNGDRTYGDDAAGMCGKCHVAVTNQFKVRSAHPLNEGIVTCISCHDVLGQTTPAFEPERDAACRNCHPMQAGPFMFEHEASGSFSPEGSDCVACHIPHGSSNERLLTQTGGRLCQQCHGIPPLHRVTHNGIGMLRDCVECHSSVHGSHDNQGLLDPFLGTKVGTGSGSCFCHGAEN